MKGALNQGDWKNMEMAWQNTVKNGQAVEVELTVKYGGKRPDLLKAKYWIDGQEGKASYVND